MTTIALAGLVLLLAISFWRPLRSVRRVLGVAHLAASGHVFLVLGVLVGLAIGIASDRRVVIDLAPIVAFAAGWIGFSAGAHFEVNVLRTVPRRAFARALAPALAAALAVGAVSAGVLHLADASTAQLWAGSMCLAAVAASAGPTLAAVLRTRRAKRSPQAAATLRMVEFSAGIADIAVVLLAITAFALFRPPADAGEAPTVLALALGGAVLLGAALWLFLGDDSGEDERLLLGLGMLAMIAGLGGWLEVAPAAIAAVSGAVLANLPGQRAQSLLAAVRRVERPVVVILMTVIGMYLSTGMSWHVAPLAFALVAVRLGAKRLAEGRPQPALAGDANLAAPAGWSFGLTPQGTLGLVVALSFFHVWRDELAATVLAAAALAAIANELLAPVVLLGSLRRLVSDRSEA